MSTAIHHAEQQPRTEWYDCEHNDCQGLVTQLHAIEGSYCSRECYLRSRGQRLLNMVRNDHRFCYTCFRQLKTVETVPEWQKRRLGPVTYSAVDRGGGYQYLTENARIGERKYNRPGTLPDDTRRGTICKCGQTNHRDRESVIQSSNIKDVARSLYATLETFNAEGQTDKFDVDYLTLVRVLYSQYQHDDRDGYDFPLAVGIAAMEAE